MSPNRTLRYLLTAQGLFYGAMNVWALIATRGFLARTNPLADAFQARSFAGLALVVAIFLLAGVWRKDLLRPAAFLGLGSSIAIMLVELFHLPALGWSLLWVDMFVQLALAALYIMVFFFTKEEEPVATEEETPAQEVPPAAVEPLKVPDAEQVIMEADDVPSDNPLF